MTPSNPAPVGDEREELSSKQIEAGWHKTFSTSNPFCPCDLKSFTKAVRWAERALSSSTVQQVGAEKVVAALRDLSAMYAQTWDRVDGALLMMDSTVPRFEAAHEAAYKALQEWDASSPKSEQGDQQ